MCEYLNILHVFARLVESNLISFIVFALLRDAFVYFGYFVCRTQTDLDLQSKYLFTPSRRGNESVQ